MIIFSEHMVGRKYQVVLKDDSAVIGKCISYIPAKDNEPEIDSIWIETEDNEIKEFLLSQVKQLSRCATTEIR